MADSCSATPPKPLRGSVGGTLLFPAELHHFLPDTSTRYTPRARPDRSLEAASAKKWQGPV
jgi:hypothetical protein